MKILIDSREPNLIKQAFDNAELSNLDLGDIIIKDSQDNILVIFERKTIDDLLSSVKDSRYTDQSDRLSNLDLQSNKIYYIIEGNRYNYSGTQEKTLYSCIYSLSYKKGFSVILTNNTNDTVQYIKEFYSRIDNCKGVKKEINLIKKEKVSKNNIYPLMLTTIPGVGLNISKGILNNFKDSDNNTNEINNMNLLNLLNSLKTNPDCLNNLKINNRKISNKIIENIKFYLL